MGRYTRGSRRDRRHKATENLGGMARPPDRETGKETGRGTGTDRRNRSAQADEENRRQFALGKMLHAGHLGMLAGHEVSLYLLCRAAFILEPTPHTLKLDERARHRASQRGTRA